MRVEPIRRTLLGLVVFDELDIAQSKKLGQQLKTYFSETFNGQQRARKILPEPFFVHSELTTLTQLADLVAYSLNWGWRLSGKTNKPTREEMAEFGVAFGRMQFRGKIISVHQQQEFPIFGICYIDDLRPKQSRIDDEE